MVNIFVEFEEQQMRCSQIQKITITRNIWDRRWYKSSSILSIILPNGVIKLPLWILQEDSHTSIDRVVGYIWWVQEMAQLTQLTSSQSLLYQVTQRRDLIEHTTNYLEQKELSIWTDRKGVFEDIEIQVGED